MSDHPTGLTAHPARNVPARLGIGQLVRERFIQFRNQCIASAGFRKAVLRVPVLRWVAHREASGLFDLAAGFIYSQVLGAFVELKLVDQLRGEPRTVTALAEAVAVPPEALRRLLEAAAVLELAESLPRDRFTLGPKGAALVDNPGVQAMVRHHRHLYADLADPVALLRANRAGETALRRFWRYAELPPEARAEQLTDADVGAYSELMRTSQSALVDEVLAGFSFKDCRRLLDVGGGYGHFVSRVAEVYPALECTIFDLPPVAEAARHRLAGAAAAGRITTVGGDFTRDPLPAGADLVTFLRVLHDHDDAVVKALLRAVWAALPPGGRLLIAEPLADAPGFSRVGHTYFGIYLFAMGSGRPRTAVELTHMLEAAGFHAVSVRQTRMPLEGTLLIAHKGTAT